MNGCAAGQPWSMPLSSLHLFCLLHADGLLSYFAVNTAALYAYAAGSSEKMHAQASSVPVPAA